MKTIYAISSTGKTEKSFLDLRFGKCEYIVLYNSENKEYEILENTFKEKEKSGVQLVKFLQKKGVSTIITGEVGHKVSSLLEKKKLQLVLLNEEKIKIEEIFERLQNRHK